MTYQETVDWMFAQLPMYQRIGKGALNAKLDNIRALAKRLGHPQTKFKSIHVAGTNGKGSSSHMLASVLQEAGYKVGLYTSPHLKDFRERIKVNGKPVGEPFVIQFIAENKAYFDTNNLSFFEMTVGMAFEFFARQKVDIAIIEVGLGGRLDATNIILPEVSLITNIGLDHMDTLGDTLLKITREKAGIIKMGVPVVISEYQEEIAPIFKSIAKRQHADLVFADKTIKDTYKTALTGNYQSRNVKGVVAALQQLKGFTIDKDHIRAGLENVIANTGIMGRWQVLQEDPKVICDTGHNSEGLSIVLSQLVQQKYRQLHIVLGFVREKNLDAILPLFPGKALYYFSQPDVPRGLDVKILEASAIKYGLHGESYASVPLALQEALQKAEKDDLVFVGGSTFTVAEVV
ncbi:MAG TPA: folylpolyglutamate synthase/dihydrofolate synthase family protein [Eudoraea sp.]|nr:folylpolyglutamate synthase/dihydrofolate synthase family protein [Eudoraea sp.]